LTETSGRRRRRMYTGNENIVTRHAEATQRLKRVRWVGPIALAVVVIFNVWSVVSMFKAVDTQSVVNKVEARVIDQVVPEVQSDLFDMATRLQPKLEASLMQWSKDFAPQLHGRMMHEATAFEQNATKDFERIMIEASSRTDAAQRAIIAKYIPELADDTKAQDRVIASVQAAAAKWGVKQYTTALHGHARAFDDIRQTLNAHYASDGQNFPTGSHVLSLWIELVGESLGIDDTIIDAADTASGQTTSTTRG
jgi:hypothetical protein